MNITINKRELKAYIKIEKLQARLDEAEKVVLISYDNIHTNKDDFIKHVQVSALKYLTKYKIKD